MALLVPPIDPGCRAIAQPPPPGDSRGGDQERQGPLIGLQSLGVVVKPKMGIAHTAVGLHEVGVVGARGGRALLLSRASDGGGLLVPKANRHWLAEQVGMGSAFKKIVE